MFRSRLRTLKPPELFPVEKEADDAKGNTETCHQQRCYNRGHQPQRPTPELPVGHDDNAIFDIPGSMRYAKP